MGVITKSRQVEQKLRRAISRGVFLPGSPLPPEVELLTKYNVSRTTLRDALNTLASEGILYRHQGKGTFVAKSLKKNHISILARLDRYASAVGHYTRTIVDELNRYIEGAGYQPNFIVGQGKTEDEFSASIHLLDRPITNKILGVISLEELGEFSKYLDRAGIVNVSIVTGESQCNHCILLDYWKLSEMVKEAFASFGIKNYAVMYQRPLEEQINSTWHIAYKKAVLNSAPSPRHLVEIDFSWDFGGAYESFKNWWSSYDRPEAIFFWDDSLCDVASRAFLEFDIRVPRDLKVLSFANKGRRFHLPYQLSTIGFDLEYLASLTWQKLQKLINGDKTEKSLSVEPRLFAGISLQK